MQGILASYFFALEVHDMSQILVNNLIFNYENSYDNIFEKVSFSIDTDWKLGFIGRNGRGKTTFLNLLMGKYEYGGNITKNVTFDYFPYVIPENLMKEDTIQVIEYMDSNYELWKICRELNLMNMDGDLLYRPFLTLSNGERTKVMLAVLFSKENNFLLIDEPTNHLDLEARENVRDYLKLKKGFILVSHDRWILDACIDHVLVINKTNISVEQGNFSTWWDNKKRQDEFELSENAKLKKDITRLSEAAKRAEGWSEQIEKSKIGSHSADRGFIGHKAAKMMKRAKTIENRMENFTVISK
ncbi:MAG: ATPase component of transporter with duplicated ATPase domain [Anaerocolumna sp.]|nr:ATPase component of transporter with duplicated ATPase domain [Anaerocolumna sp.]